MESVQSLINRNVGLANAGKLLFPSDFRGKGSEGAIKMALSRLATEGKLKRLAHGIYFVPIVDPKLGELTPAPEAVAEELAKKEKVRIRPSGAFALNKLGLSTQVPTKLVYLTDGHPRRLTIGKAVVEFKATTPKKMALIGHISSLLILGLQELDLNAIDKNKEQRIYALMQQESPNNLEHDLQLAPGKVYDYLFKLKKEIDDKRMALFNGR